MNTIEANMPIPVSGGNASKAETGPGRFKEFLNMQKEQKSRECKDDVDSRNPMETMLNGQQLSPLFFMPGMNELQLFSQGSKGTFGEVVAGVQNTAEPMLETAGVQAGFSNMPEGTQSVSTDNAQRVLTDNAQIVSEDLSVNMAGEEVSAQTEPNRSEAQTGAFKEQPKELAAPEKETAARQIANVERKPEEGTGLQKQDTDPESRQTDALMQAVLTGRNEAEPAPVIRSMETTEKAMAKSDVSPEYMEQLKNHIAKSVAEGKRELEIQLNPANLGKLIIKASYEAGKSIISIVCSEARTMEAMSQQARELAAMVEDRTGNRTDVVIEHPTGDYLQQSKQQGNEQRNNSESQHKQSRNSQFHEQSDFLQQLRLGLA